ncbi:hypothetical protein AAFM46_13210 [Arthrobacter sp. TMP15]|uniref:hypothetical protein n=1 Tax=Arthrobacter sp. TMP15 TaxID=3140789 RepID=UPI0031B9E7DE
MSSPQVIQIIASSINNTNNVIQCWILVRSRADIGIGWQIADLTDEAIPFEHSPAVLAVGSWTALRH